VQPHGALQDVRGREAITISAEGVEAGVLVSGTNAIIINAPNTASIILRGLDIEGLGTGLVGIKVLQAGHVHVEKCTIHNFTQAAIDFRPTSGALIANSALYVTDTIIRDNLGAAAGGIFVKPGINVTTATATIDNVLLNNNSFGIFVQDGGKVFAKNTTASNSSSSGFLATSTTAVAALMFLDKCTSANNAGSGIISTGASATVRITGCTITNNGNIGLNSVSSGRILSFGNNYNDGNGVGGTNNGAPTPLPSL
jgi:hypothetical protein